MNVHTIWSLIFKIFRKRRFRLFLEKIRPDKNTRILDVGGYPQTWTPHTFLSAGIHIINVREIPEATDTNGHLISYGQADGCALPFQDGQFDIGFSNSVIEHVGDWNRQKQFASELRRTARELWVQTPAREFWIEPHFMMPFIHWLPRRWRIRLARNFTLWGWLARPTRERVEETVNEIRLISLPEMKELFPDCEILKEKFLLVFTKSYVAVRSSSSAPVCVEAEKLSASAV